MFEHKSKIRGFFLNRAILLIGITWLVSCTLWEIDERIPSIPQEELFFPPANPSPEVTFTNTKSPIENVPVETNEREETSAPITLPCDDDLSFLKDITIPDGTKVSPVELLEKVWQVENSGSCNWNENYRVKSIAGPLMGAPEQQALYPARSGERAFIRLFFVAPLEAGVFRSAWQAFNPAGDPFGDTFFIEIKVMRTTEG